jgi:hypothetical protein
MTVLDELLALRSDLTAALTRVDDLVASARQEHPGAVSPSVDVTALPRTRAIEWALAQRSAPLRPVEIWAVLRAAGRDDPKMEVQVTTYDLWQRGRIEKVERGLYRALSQT